MADEQHRQAGPAAAPTEPAGRGQAAGNQRRESPARDGMALGLAVGTSGLAFGAAAVSSGLSPAQACVLSLLTFTGASQFALAGAAASGGLAAGVAGAVLLGSRNTLYGLRLASLLQVRGPRRLLAAQRVIDETTAIALAVVGPAAFFALIWPRLRAGRTERGVALLGAAIALAATPFLPPGVPVILAATAALAGALMAPAP